MKQLTAKQALRITKRSIKKQETDIFGTLGEIQRRAEQGFFHIDEFLYPSDPKIKELKKLGYKVTPQTRNSSDGFVTINWKL